jgi:hypothetical protein
MDTSEYIPEFQRTDDFEHVPVQRPGYGKARAPRHVGVRSAVLTLLIVCTLLVSVWLAVTVVVPIFNAQPNAAQADVIITPTIRDDLAAHTITIPGEDGQRISIRELRTSAIVTGGVATFDIPDHIWYDDYEDFLQESMTVTLTPYLITDTGKQTPLAAITYDIDIPLSAIDLVTPDSPYKLVSTAMYTIVFYVSEGSTVTINNTDYSDLVNTEGGKVSYNATVQPVGENVFNISVRSQYCRENSLTVTLYREKQDIPLDLSSDIYSRSNDSVMTVRATTLPGAVVNVLSPTAIWTSPIPPRRLVYLQGAVRYDRRQHHRHNRRLSGQEADARGVYGVLRAVHRQIQPQGVGYREQLQRSDGQQRPSQVAKPDIQMRRNDYLHRDHQAAARLYGVHYQRQHRDRLH